MNLRLLTFIGTLTLILFLGASYLAYRTSTRIDWGARHKSALWVIVVLFLLLQIAGPYLYRVNPWGSVRPFAVQWITYSTLGLFCCLLVYILVGDFVGWIWSIFARGQASPDQVTRRTFLIASISAITTAGIGTWQAWRGPKVVEVKIKIKNLPRPFVGLKIAQISDLHVGPLIAKNYVERVTSLTQAQNPDLIVLTGDMVDGTPERLRPDLEAFKSLRAPMGQFFITGNHEYYWNSDLWCEEFKTMGFEPLRNQHRVLSRGSDQIILAGVDDPTSKNPESRVTTAFDRAPESLVRILLAHRPGDYLEASQSKVDLQLSGHTHGGQFFPWNLVVAMAHRYYRGLNRHENTWIYVNSGTGYWGPPTRFAIPSEITLIELT